MASYQNIVKFACAWFALGTLSAFRYGAAETQGINNFIAENQYKYDKGDEAVVGKVDTFMREYRNGIHLRFIAGPLMFFCRRRYAKNYPSD